MHEARSAFGLRERSTAWGVEERERDAGGRKWAFGWAAARRRLLFLLFSWWCWGGSRLRRWRRRAATVDDHLGRAVLKRFGRPVRHCMAGVLKSALSVMLEPRRAPGIRASALAARPASGSASCSGRRQLRAGARSSGTGV